MGIKGWSLHAFLRHTTRLVSHGINKMGFDKRICTNCDRCVVGYWIRRPSPSSPAAAAVHLQWNTIDFLCLMMFFHPPCNDFAEDHTCMSLTDPKILNNTTRGENLRPSSTSWPRNNPSQRHVVKKYLIMGVWKQKTTATIARNQKKHDNSGSPTSTIKITTRRGWSWETIISHIVATKNTQS